MHDHSYIYSGNEYNAKECYKRDPIKAVMASWLTWKFHLDRQNHALPRNKTPLSSKTYFVTFLHHILKMNNILFQMLPLISFAFWEPHHTRTVSQCCQYSVFYGHIMSGHTMSYCGLQPVPHSEITSLIFFCFLLFYSFQQSALHLENKQSPVSRCYPKWYFILKAHKASVSKCYQQSQYYIQRTFLGIIQNISIWKHTNLQYINVINNQYNILRILPNAKHSSPVHFHDRHDGWVAGRPPQDCSLLSTFHSCFF